MTYSTLKLVFIVALVWLGYGVAGGVGGFALAAISVLAVSAINAGKGTAAGEVRASELLRFQAYLLAFTFVLNLLQKVDLILVKALSSPESSIADLNAGSYSAAINVANLTYQVIISVTFIIFPLVSQSTFQQEQEKTRGYIDNTIRYTLMVMALLATLFSANASEVLRVIYPESYQDGSAALSVVAFGMLGFGLLQVMTTIISASGRPMVSLAIGAATLGVSVLLNSVLIPSRGITGAAVSTTVAMLIGVVLAGGYLLSRFGGLIRPLSLVRIALCACVVYFGSIFFAPASIPIILAQLAGLSLAYAGMLILTGELNRQDLDSVKKVLGK
jgi:stage V sporulation protein B